MPALDPTLVIACSYSPMRRALIERLQLDFPNVRLRLVYDLAHLTLGISTGFEGVFVDSSALAARIHALHDVCGPLPVFVCDTPGWYAPDAPRRHHSTSTCSALPTLLNMLPLARPSAVLELERLLVGVFAAPRPVGEPQDASNDTSCVTEESRLEGGGFILGAV